jgi:hypothetical protein
MRDPVQVLGTLGERGRGSEMNGEMSKSSDRNQCAVVKSVAAKAPRSIQKQQGSNWVPQSIHSKPLKNMLFQWISIYG